MSDIKPSEAELVACTNCNGSGKVHSHNPICWECKGFGKVTKAKARAINRKLQKLELLTQHRTGDYE